MLVPLTGICSQLLHIWDYYFLWNVHFKLQAIYSSKMFSSSVQSSILSLELKSQGSSICYCALLFPKQTKLAMELSIRVFDDEMTSLYHTGIFPIITVDVFERIFTRRVKAKVLAELPSHILFDLTSILLTVTPVPLDHSNLSADPRLDEPSCFSMVWFWLGNCLKS